MLSWADGLWRHAFSPALEQIESLASQRGGVRLVPNSIGRREVMRRAAIGAGTTGFGIGATGGLSSSARTQGTFVRDDAA